MTTSKFESTPARHPVARALMGGLVLVCMSVACSDAAERSSSDTGVLGSTRQAIGEGTCATTNASATLQGNAVFQSPATYSTEGCLDAVVIDILDMPLRGTIRTRLVGTPPADAEACANIELAANYSGDIEGEGLVDLGASSVFGTFSGRTCTFPELDFRPDSALLPFGLNNDELEVDARIRIAAGARSIEGFRFTQLPLTVVYED